MLGTTLANLRAHKGRLLLSSVAIVLATAFIAGTFVFTDAMRTALVGAFTKDLGEADVVVTAPGTADVPGEVLAAVRQAEGVTYTQGRVTGRTTLHNPDDLRDVPGLSDVAAVHTATARLQGRRVVVSGVDPQKLAAVTAEMPELSRLDPGEAVLTETLSRRLGSGPGDALRLDDGSESTVKLTVSSILTGEGPAIAYTTQQDLGRIFPDAPVRAVYARAAPDADLAEVGAAIDRATAGIGVTVLGTADNRAPFTRVLNIVLLVVTALLAVAVLIAVVGIANTLTLSVIERTRESALLRALGLTRGQLRATLAVEAALMAIVGALLGVGLGIVFGWAAVTTMLGSLEIVLAVPWLRLAGLTAVAVAAGLLASILPARRAARTSIVSALADE